MVTEVVTNAVPSDIPELLSTGVRVAWELATRDGGGLTGVDALLRPYALHERIVGHFLVGPGCVVVEPDGVLGRLSALGEWSDELVVALAGPPEGELDVGRFAASQVDRHWSDWAHATHDDRIASCAVFALSRRLPFELTGLSAVTPDEPLGSELENLLAFAIGLASDAGDASARQTLRDLLAEGDGVGCRTEVARALVLGLGGGLYSAGLERLLSLARGAISEEDVWASALMRAVVAVCEGTEPGDEVHVPEEGGRGTWQLSPLLFSTLCLQRTPLAAERFVRVLNRTGWGAPLVSLARDRFVSAPPEVRTLVAEAFLAGFRVDGARLEPPGGLVRERSASVLTIILDLLARVSDAIPEELKITLGRAYADHPDVAVRVALAKAIPPRRSAPRGGEHPGGVVALPPTALARDDLDRLRVAILTGDSDRIVELATCVPLDKRAAARESLLCALEIPNAPLRRATVEAVGRIGSQSDGPRLLDAARRYRALEGTVAAALRELNAKSCAEALAELYRRRLKWADDEAVDDYCALAGPEKVGYLREALEGRYYPPARSGAARALARHQIHEAVFALRNAGLSDTSEVARQAALQALHDLTGSSPTSAELAGHALLYKPAEDLPAAIARAREAGLPALAGIRRTLARGSWKRRVAACEVLAHLAQEEASTILLEVLSDPDEDVRLAALEALIDRGWAPSHPSEFTKQELAARRIRESVTHPARIDVRTLVAALGLGGHVFRVETLEALEALDGFQPTPEDAAFIYAARGDVERAVEFHSGLDAVLRVADHTWHRFPHRGRLVRGLCALTVDALEEALEVSGTEWGWRARQVVAQALYRHDPAAAAEAVRVLGRSIGELDDDVRRSVLESLAWWGTPEAAAVVARGFESPFQEDRELVGKTLGTFGPRALEAIDRLLDEPWWEARHGAALALSRWRESIDVAVDRLIVLAVDPEHRVAQAARDGLLSHGLLPTIPAICRALGRAQAFSIEGLEPWLGLHQSPTAPPEIAHALDHLVEDTPVDMLAQRLQLISLFRAHHLALWLEQTALGRTQSEADEKGQAEPRFPPGRRVEVRIAAAEALRALLRGVCTVCQGEGKVRCPECGGAGRTTCSSCGGRGLIAAPCPEVECTAKGNLRVLGAPRCGTCRGRGEIAVACACESASGKVPCVLCHAEGLLTCAGCGGTGVNGFFDEASQ